MINKKILRLKYFFYEFICEKFAVIFNWARAVFDIPTSVSSLLFIRLVDPSNHSKYILTRGKLFVLCVN